MILTMHRYVKQILASPSSLFIHIDPLTHKQIHTHLQALRPPVKGRIRHPPTFHYSLKKLTRKEFYSSSNSDSLSSIKCCHRTI